MNVINREERGAAVLEYCLLGSLIAVALIAAVGSVGDATEEVFVDVGLAISAGTGEITGPQPFPN